MIMRFYFLFLSVLLLSACGVEPHDDLIAFMAEIKAKPAGRIEAIPTFNTYKPFDYGATALRGPFDKPVTAKGLVDILPSSTVVPDPNRPKEYLEQFSIESLIMVGTLEQHDQLWLLLDDGEGNVHYVKKGNYLGKNHGKIVTAEATYFQIMEILPNGSGGWLERPRTIELKEE